LLQVVAGALPAMHTEGDPVTCPDGTAAMPLSGSDREVACMPCPIGHYSTGGKPCTPCLTPHYAWSRGAAVCLTCPGRTEANLPVGGFACGPIMR